MVRSRSSTYAIVWVLGLLFTTAMAQSEPRIALIITNQNYARDELDLQNPHADGDSIKAALETVGFDVTLVRDTTHRGELDDAIGKYVARLADAGPDAVGFFYYSGHGAADGPQGHNYLLPTEVNITHAAELSLSAVSVENIVNALSQTGGKMSFVVFDACRNVPLLRQDKSNYKGFAPYRDAPGMLIAYATEPGDVAADESYYSRALAEEIVKPNREAGSVFRAVSRRVFQDTGGGQRPVPIDKRFDDFYFKPAVGVVNSEPSTPSCKGIKVSLGTGEMTCINPGSGQSFRDCWNVDNKQVCGPEMVVVPAGSFMMGSRDGEGDTDEHPRHEVKIQQPFAVGKFEVSFADWDRCIAAGGCKHEPKDEWGRGNQPVINISWTHITSEYLPWLRKVTRKNYRLLSEAEWEYAARAGTTAHYSFGDNESALGNFAWLNSNSGLKTHAVGGKKPNPWGLYDVHGNVWEWCEDRWHDSYADKPDTLKSNGGAWITEGSGPRVLRGGAWGINPGDLRSADRLGVGGPDLKYSIIGFRVARTLTP